MWRDDGRRVPVWYFLAALRTTYLAGYTKPTDVPVTPFWAKRARTNERERARNSLARSPFALRPAAHIRERENTSKAFVCRSRIRQHTHTHTRKNGFLTRQTSHSATTSIEKQRHIYKRRTFFCTINREKSYRRWARKKSFRRVTTIIMTKEEKTWLMPLVWDIYQWLELSFSCVVVVHCKTLNWLFIMLLECLACR